MNLRKKILKERNRLKKRTNSSKNCCRSLCFHIIGYKTNLWTHFQDSLMHIFIHIFKIYYEWQGYPQINSSEYVLEANLHMQCKLQNHFISKSIWWLVDFLVITKINFDANFFLTTFLSHLLKSFVGDFEDICHHVMNYKKRVSSSWTNIDTLLSKGNKLLSRTMCWKQHKHGFCNKLFPLIDNICKNQVQTIHTRFIAHSGIIICFYILSNIITMHLLGFLAMWFVLL